MIIAMTRISFKFKVSEGDLLYATSMEEKGSKRGWTDGRWEI